jgi:hypothetical protein
MRTAGIRQQDIVLADVRGTIFYAKVHDVGPQKVEVTQLDKSNMSVPYRILTARQIKAHYSKRKG